MSARLPWQVLLGLTYLHKELHIVHRDVKPCNLLVNRQGKVKISDFGVSGKLASSVADCASWVGTVTYMSPERISGKCYSFDSDVWSLGLSMMECAQGECCILSLVLVYPYLVRPSSLYPNTVC